MFRVIFLSSIFFTLVTAKRQCRDTDKRCFEWGSRGDCVRDQELRRRCPQTCGVCPTEDEQEILRNIDVSAQHTLLFVYVLVGFFVFAFFIAIIKIRNTGGVCLSKGNMKGKLVVITGATSGIGLDTAFHLALRGAKVVIGCRNIKAGFKIAKDLRAQTGQKMIEIRKLDLSSFDSIRDFANMITEQFPNIDVLINNAGIYSGKKRSTTMDGYESTFQTNYLGHFYLTKLLMSSLKESTPSRIINLVSDEFKKGKLDFQNLQGKRDFNNSKAYRNANLAIMYFTKELSNFLKDTGVTVNVANPGKTCTNLWRDIFPYGWNLTWVLASPFTYLYWKSASMGAETSYYCAFDRDLEKVSGCYFKDCKEEPFPELDDEVGRKLWVVSERLLEPKKLSTLNQAAIKKALNEIAEAEAEKDSGQSSLANEPATENTEEVNGSANFDTTDRKITKSKLKKPTNFKKSNGEGNVKKKDDDFVSSDEKETGMKPVEKDEKIPPSKSSKTNLTSVRNRKLKKKIPVKKE